MRRKKLRAVALSMALYAVTGVVEAYTLSEARVFPIPAWPNAWPDVVAVGDVNCDGRADAIVATTRTDQGPNPENDYRLFVFLQQAGGVLAQPIRIPYTTLDQEGDNTRGFRKRTGITAGDLNRDRCDDVVVGRRDGLAIVYGSRSAEFVPRIVLNTTGAASGDAPAIADFDGDDFADIISHNETGGDGKFGLTLYRGDSGGTFADQRYTDTRSDGGIELKVRDVNGDRHPDVAVSWLQGLDDGVEIFISDGSGDFKPPIYIKAPPEVISARTMSLGDFAGGDGRVDVVLGGFDFSRGLYLYVQRADGTFSGPSAVPTSALDNGNHVPDGTIGHDMDGDQKDDLVVWRSGGTLGLMQQSTWTLGGERNYAGPYFTWGGVQTIAVGDLNSDGCNDVAAVSYNHGLVVWQGRDCFVAVNGSAPLAPPSSGMNMSGSTAFTTLSPSERPVQRWRDSSGGRKALIALLLILSAWRLLRWHMHR